ncbi:hypothetical protein C2845_PM05G22600 [Panicum miliaceum]|uniref:Uncharacterized protein n=1 Tax=Panicum miliaceum TaxID=4540 RepID=A0A3L6SYC8_PANMI|nr:hypothetical protein C2845_PM05G22600 [Panicum miliaceum]
MSQTGSSTNSSAQHEEPAHSGAPSGQTTACSTSQRRRPRTQTKWPTDVVKVEGIDGEGFPTNDNGLKRWRLICGLITRQRVGINVNFEDVDEPARQGLFETMKEYLEFPEGTSEAQMNLVRGAAWSQSPSSTGKEPFDVHKHLDRRDWEMFVESTTSEQFLEKMPYLRARATPTPSTGQITWSSDGTKRLADRVIELKNHESGVREHDILSTAIDTLEHRGRVRGVSSSKGWREAFGKENECLWKKKKRSSVDPDQLKQEIKDEIFGMLRAAGIDVDAALGTSIGKSSCASKEVEQPLASPAANISSPPPPLTHSIG